jgi:DHA2 family multidrug resistance protein
MGVGTSSTVFYPLKCAKVGLGASFSMWQLSRLNLEAGYWNIFWAQFIQGFSLALLFVPLTTITMDPIRREEMGYATSMFNLLRNLGGSIGIAVATTYLYRRQQYHRVLLGANVNPYNQTAQGVIHSIQSALMARGSDALQALQQAYGVVGGMVQRQAAMLSFVDTFRMMALVFLLVLPLLLLLKRPKTHGKPDVMAH